MRATTKGWLLAGALLLGVTTPGCDPVTAAALPALIITNTWDVEGDENRDFGFTSSDDGETSGTFVGSEFVNGEEVHTLTGAWSEGAVSFTLSSGAAYTGTFHDDLPDRLVVSSSAETVVLIRQPQN